MSAPTLVVADRLDPADAKTWDALVDESPLPSPFLRSWWLAAVRGPHTRYLLLREGDELLGGLVLDRRRRLGVTRWTAPGPAKLSPDHLDVVARPEDGPRVAAAVVGHLAARRSWVLDLDGLRDGSWLVRSLAATGRRAAVEEVERAPFVRLPSSLEDYLRDRSKNLRRKATKVRRRAAADGLEAHVVGPDRLPAVLDAFEALHRARGDRDEFLQDVAVVRAAVTGAMRAGEAVVHVAEKHGRVGAVAIGFRVGGAVRNYQAARDLSEEFGDAPTLVELSVIEGACADGLVEFDFLRGAAPYKYSYCDQDRPVLRLRAGAGAGRAVLAAATAARRLVRALRHLRRLPSDHETDRSQRKG